MSEHYSQADYERDLGITSPGYTHESYEAAREAAEWAEYDRKLQQIREGRTDADDLLDKALGINATEAEQQEAMRKLEEHDRYPWRPEWPRAERLSRLGEEQELIALYQAKLGESATSAAEHVHRELSSAWAGRVGVEERLASVSSRLASERDRMSRATSLAEHRAPAATGPVYRGKRGEYVQITESNQLRPGWLR